MQKKEFQSVKAFFFNSGPFTSFYQKSISLHIICTMLYLVAPTTEEGTTLPPTTTPSRKFSYANATKIRSVV